MQLVKAISVHLNLFIRIKFLIYNFALYNDSTYKLFNQINIFRHSIHENILEEINIFLNMHN